MMPSPCPVRPQAVCSALWADPVRPLRGRLRQALSTCLAVLGVLVLSGCSTLSPDPSASQAALADRSPVEVTRPESALDPDWYRKAVFMEIYLRGYRDSDGDGKGDLRGLTERLDYLKSLGIGGIWLMPMMKSQDQDHGYAVVDYRAVEPDYGTLEDFDHFLAEAHRRGIGVIIDYVLNHSAARHPLFEASRQPDSAVRDWYVWTEEARNWPRWDYENAWHKAEHGYYYGVFWSQMPDFNLANPAVLDWHKNNLRFWLNRGVDGFRFDAVGSLIENGNGRMFSQPENDQILRALQAVLAQYSNRYMVCEDPTGSLQVAEKDSCGSAFYFGLHKEIMDSARYGWPSRDLLGAIRRAPHADMALMLANHDAFAGNRVIRQTGGDEKSYRMATALLLTLPGIPFLYYGEEYGLGHTEGESGDHALRAPMSWDDRLPNAGFSEGPRIFRRLADNVATHNVRLAEENADSLLQFYRTLITTRNQLPALQNGDFQALAQEAPGLLAFTRTTASQQALVVINLGPQAARLAADTLSPGSPVAGSMHPQEWTQVFSWSPEPGLQSAFQGGILAPATATASPTPTVGKWRGEENKAGQGEQTAASEADRSIPGYAIHIFVKDR